MTDEEKFEVVLTELRHLLLALGDLSQHVVLIGGQVVAIESRRLTGTGLLQVTTDTGIIIGRGYSFEPDVLFDAEAAGQLGEMLPDIFRRSGYEKVREFRWSKRVGDIDVPIDLFLSKSLDEDQRPFGATALPNADLVLARPKLITVQLRSGATLEVSVPSPVGFLRLKADARLTLRPSEHRDSFDAFAYVRLMGWKAIAQALIDAPRDAPALRHDLASLFGSVTSSGVLDVVAYARSLNEMDRALLAQAVVDAFEPILRVGQVR